MKRILFVSAVVLSAVFYYSCKDDTGAPGAAVMTFQNGISPYPAWNGIAENRIVSGSPTYNHGSCNNFSVGYYNSAGTYISRTLIKADLSAIVPDNVIVQKAYLSLNSNSFAGAATVTAYAVTSNWPAGSGTCANSAANDSSWYNSATGLTWAYAGGDFSATKANDSVVFGMDNAGFNILTLDPTVVQNWIDNTAQNFGLMLKGTDETGSFTQVGFSSSDGSLEFGPKFTIYYKIL